MLWQVQVAILERGSRGDATGTQGGAKVSDTDGDKIKSGLDNVGCGLIIAAIIFSWTVYMVSSAWLAKVLPQ